MSTRKNIINQNPTNEELAQRVIELEMLLQQMQKRASSASSNRKQDVLNLLRTGPTSIKTIAVELGTTTRNVSSVLTGLKKDGYIIHTDEQLRKYLVESPKTEAQQEPVAQTEAEANAELELLAEANAELDDETHELLP